MTYSLKKRPQPSLWVTSTAALLTGEKKCTFAIRQQANYYLPPVASDYDFSKHDEQVLKRACQLKSEGFTVYVENDNSFSVQGKTYDIRVAGKPDIVAIKNDWVVVEDIKTGKRKDSHKMQVLLYMLLLPVAPETKHLCQGKIPHGRLIYNDDIVEIPHWQVDRPFKQHLREAIATLCDPKPVKAQPSQWECRYCKLSSEHCSLKVMPQTSAVG
jgi:hypothetical protein